MAISGTDFWSFITEFTTRNPNLGLPALEDGFFANSLIFDYLYNEGNSWKGPTAPPPPRHSTLTSPPPHSDAPSLSAHSDVARSRMVCEVVKMWPLYLFVYLSMDFLIRRLIIIYILLGLLLC